MLKAYKYRLYPTEIQKLNIEKHIGCSRFVYNYMLALHKNLYENNDQKWNKYEYVKKLVPLKKSEEYSWLKEVNSQALQQSILQLDAAFKNMFAKRARFPKFKKKNKSKNSFHVPQNVSVFFDEKLVFFPKFKEGIKCIFHRRFGGNIRNATVSRTKTNKYYISIIVETEKDLVYELPEPSVENSIGIDLGIKDFAVLSDGTKIENPEIKKYNKRIEHLHRNLSRKKKGSNNRNKARLKLARLYEKVDNIKTDFLHKLSHEIVNKNHVDYIFMEDLNVSGMLKNHKLARSIASASWYKFYTFLQYKTDWKGKQIIKIGRFEPSSKLCSVCGYKNKELKLSDRQWTCPNCGILHDRDINAAINIRNIGLNTAGTAGFQACGESVSLVFSKAVLREAGSPHFKTVSQV
jgi:putative transposase